MLSFVVILQNDIDALTGLAAHLLPGDQVVVLLHKGAAQRQIAAQLFAGVLASPRIVDLIRLEAPIAPSDGAELGLRQARHLAVVLEDGDRIKPAALTHLRQIAENAALVDFGPRGGALSVAAAPAVIRAATARYCGSARRLNAALRAAAAESIAAPWIC